MKEMQKIAGVATWIPTAQCKWDEIKSKIVVQAQLEATHKSRLRHVLQEVEERGRFITSVYSFSAFTVYTLHVYTS